MIKILKKQKLTEVDKELKDAMVVFSRSGKKLYAHNIDHNLPISFNPETGKVIIELTMNPGDVIVIGDKDGFESKSEV